jgi:hypothetical protein
MEIKVVKEIEKKVGCRVRMEKKVVGMEIVEISINKIVELINMLLVS